MNDNQLDDLKQFITATVSQAEGQLGGRIDSIYQRAEILDSKVESLDAKIEAMHQEIIEGFAGVGEAMEEVNKLVDERLTKLEQQTT